MPDIVHALTDGVVRYLAVSSMAALVLVLLALAFLKVGRIRTPVYRHIIWLYCLMGIVGLPLIWLYGPKLTLAILPASVQTHEASASPGAGPYDNEFPPDASRTPPRNLMAEMSSAYQASIISWKTAGVAVWFLGFSIMLIRLVVGWMRLRRICRSAVPLQGKECPVGLVSPRLRVCLTSRLQGPVCFGMFRPVILLPKDLVHAGSPENLRMVLTHELAHIERRDCWANLFQRIVEAMYFFHPLVWLASRQLTQEREEICDNHVLAEGVSPDDYTTLLSHLGAQVVHAGQLQTVALFEGQLLSRIRSLLDPSRSRQTRLPWRVAAVCTVAVLAGFLVFGCIRLAAQPSDRAAGASPERPLSSSASAEQKPAQSSKEATGDAEERYAARTFNSKVAFEVLVAKISTATRMMIGHTPSTAPLEIPACQLWWVRPLTPVKDWDLLAQEIGRNGVPGLDLRSTTYSDLRHLVGLTSLRYLSLSDSQITDADLVYLQDLTGLRELNLMRTGITDAGLAHLKGLTGLQKLNLSGNQVTDAGLAHLKDLTRLQKLYLSSSQVTDAGLAHLEGLTRLTNLDLPGTKITDAGLAHLKGLNRLQTLYLWDSQITDAGLVHLKGLTGLQMLSLGRTQITDAGLVHLKGLAALQELRLQDTQVTDVGLEHLKVLTRLQYLELSGTRVTDAGLAHLKDLTQLEVLILDRNQITDAGLEHLKGLATLQKLTLYDTQVTDTGLKHLAGLTGLLTLDLSNTQITDAGLEHLKGLTALQELRLQDTQVTDAGLEHLKVLAALQELRLQDAQVTGLQTLDLSSTQITDAGLKHLAGLTELDLLDLSNTQITDAGLEHLKVLTGLEMLVLKRTQVTDTGLEHLKGLAELRYLDLSSTQVTDAGVKQLEQSLSTLLKVERGQAK